MSTFYIAYVSITLIGSVIIDNQSILTLIDAWLTVARDSLYRAETVYYKCKIPGRGNSKKNQTCFPENFMRFMHNDH